MLDPKKLPQSVYADAAKSDPKLARGRVWCISCGHTEEVDATKALATGWPLHCGATMTVDSPEERSKS